MPSSITTLTRFSNILNKLTYSKYRYFFASRGYSDDKKSKNPTKAGGEDEFKDIIDVLPKTFFEYPERKIQVPKREPVPLDVWKAEFRHYMDYFKDPKGKKLMRDVLPNHFDFVVIGGGFIGSSIAFWLREKHRDLQSYLVIDKNLTLERNYGCEKPEQIPAAASRGNFHQKFKSAEEIELGKFSAHFFRNISDYLDIVGEPPIDLPYRPFGVLELSNAKSSETLKKQHILQYANGVQNELLTSFQLAQRFPWLDTSDISLGCHGLECEGWIDPYTYLWAMRTRAMRYGVQYVEAEALEFIFSKERRGMMPGYDYDEYRSINEITIKFSSGELRSFTFGTCILALGAETGRFAKELLHLDRNNAGMFGLEIPIERRKRYVFVFEAPDGGPVLSSPLIKDHTGLFIQRIGVSEYICSLPPIPEEEPDASNLDVDYDFFYKRVWPFLAHRIPTFEQLQLKAGWAYYSDFNAFDGKPIVGRIPAFHNVYVAAGFGDDALQLSPGIGRGFCELIFDGCYFSADLNEFSFKRILTNQLAFDEGRNAN